MDLLGFVADLTWWQWMLVLLGAVVYIALWAVVFGFLQDNISDKAALWWTFTIGLPISLVIVVTYLGFTAAAWPWKWYQKARFHGTFDFWPGGDYSFELDQLVRKTLESRAVIFAQACQMQEDARRRKTSGEFVRLSEFDKEVKAAKKEFWRAHGLAKRFSFAPADSFRDYLTYRPDLAYVQG